MSKKTGNSGFNTHIPEPRWQQIVSVVVVVLAILFWVWIATRS